MQRHLHSSRLFTVALVSAVILVSCGSDNSDNGPDGNNQDSTAVTTAPDSVVVLTEAFLSERTENDNIDSPAFWHGPNGEHWIIATAKESDVLVVYDANSGETLRRVGGSGTAAGEFERPNGIVVIDDLAVIVERDNHRVQVLQLPEFTSLGFIGADDLKKPYGAAVIPADSGNSYRLYVTDNYELVEDQIPPDSALGERIREYSFSVNDNAVSSELVRTFGATEGDGVLRVVESIYADAANNRLMIAEEDERDTYVKVYSLDGEYTGESLGRGIHSAQTEGIVLYPCGDSEGYWIATDQSHTGNAFHVYDRTSLRHLGAFAGKTVANTDGIALTEQGYGSFPAGAFAAVHDDGGVAAISWKEIADKLSLRSDCR